MSSQLENFLRHSKDAFSRSALHASVVRRRAFEKIAAAIKNNNLTEAASYIEEERQSEFYRNISTAIATSLNKLKQIISDIKTYGGPVAELILGATLAAGGALLLTAAVEVSALIIITTILMIVVGTLIALVGIDDLQKTRRQSMGWR